MLQAYTPGHPNPILVHLELDTVQVSPGTRFDLSLSARAGDPQPFFSSLQFALSYDSTLIQIDSVSVDASISNAAFLSVNRETPGQLQVAAALSEQARLAGTLLRFSLISKNKPGTTAIQFSSFILDEGVPEVSVSGGEIVIERESSTSPLLLTIPDADVLTHEAFDISLNMDSLTDPIYSGSFSLHYDPALIEPLGLNTEDTRLDIPERILDVQIDQPGIIQVAFAAGTPLPSKPTPLIKIRFESDMLTGESPLFLSDVSFNEHAIPVLLTPGSVHIHPSPPPGDVNGDLSVAIDDALAVIKHILGKQVLPEWMLRIADVSGDGNVSAFDAALILQYVFKLIDCFPAEPACPIANRMANRIANRIANRMAYHPPIEATPFTWTSEATGSQDSLPTFSLGYTGDEALYTLEVEITVDRDFATIIDIQPTVPIDWVADTLYSNGMLYIHMAGASPLPQGAFIKTNGFVDASSLPHVSIKHASSQIQPHVSLDTQSNVNNSSYLRAVYPNPFDTALSIDFHLPSSQHVNIRLYDALGKLVLLLADQRYAEGNHSLSFAMPPIAPGVLFIQLHAQDGYRTTKKVLSF